MADINPIRCDSCGKFIAISYLCRSRYHFIPDNHFGPEEEEWVCPTCLERERQSRVLLG